MKILIDECLHTSLVGIAESHGQECRHVNWLGLSGATDWALMRFVIEGDFTLVTNNAVDFRRLYAKETLHAGLVILVPQVVPRTQCRLLDALLAILAPNQNLVNEVIELELDGEQMTWSRYSLPKS